MNFRDVTGQSFTFWYTTWPSTHVNAGQTVEVMPRAVHEAEVERLHESQKRAWTEAHDLREQACSDGDEIERLRETERSLLNAGAQLTAEVKRLREELDQHVPCAECNEERYAAEADVERLQQRMEYAMCVKCKTTDVTDCDSPFHRRIR